MSIATVTMYSTAQANWQSSAPSTRSMEWGNAAEVDDLMASLLVDEGWVGLSWKGGGGTAGSSDGVPSIKGTSVTVTAGIVTCSFGS